MAKQLRARDAESLARFERATALPVYALAFVSLVAFVSVLDNSQLAPGPVIVYAVCEVILVADLVIRAVLAPNTKAFLLGHPFDVLSVAFLPLRLLAFRRLWRVVGPQFESPKTALRGVMSVAMVLVLIGGSFMALVERAPDSNIDGVWDGIWWAFVTITTVGYGDEYPVTVSGRLIGFVTMAAGIAVWSILTATIAARFNRAMAARADDDDYVGSADVSAQVAGLEARIADLTALLTAQTSAPGQNTEDSGGTGSQPGGNT
jgi:voltage-gated potassium channel